MGRIQLLQMCLGELVMVRIRGEFLILQGLEDVMIIYGAWTNVAFLKANQSDELA